VYCIGHAVTWIFNFNVFVLESKQEIESRERDREQREREAFWHFPSLDISMAAK
jgi:hypothetical protein